MYKKLQFDIRIGSIEISTQTLRISTTGYVNKITWCRTFIQERLFLQTNGIQSLLNGRWLHSIPEKRPEETIQSCDCRPFIFFLLAPAHSNGSNRTFTNNAAIYLACAKKKIWHIEHKVLCVCRVCSYSIALGDHSITHVHVYIRG